MSPSTVRLKVKATKITTVRAVWNGQNSCNGSGKMNFETFVEFLKELRREYGRLVILPGSVSYHRYKAVDEFVQSIKRDQDGLHHDVRPATQPDIDSMEGAQGHACMRVFWIWQMPYQCNSEFDWFWQDKAGQT